MSKWEGEINCWQALIWEFLAFLLHISTYYIAASTASQITYMWNIFVGITHCFADETQTNNCAPEINKRLVLVGITASLIQDFTMLMAPPSQCLLA